MNNLLFLGSLGLQEIIILFVVLSIIIFVFSNPTNTPTWIGIIISLLTGTIVIYLILCYFGILGEKTEGI